MPLLYKQEPNGIWRKLTASLDHYQPEYIQRAAALWADHRIGDRYFVNSGSRSYAHQMYLYRLYKLHLGNLAAPPGTSDHEFDSPGHPLANAADVNPRNGGTYAELHSVAREYGFEFKIASELWHMTLRPARGPLPIAVQQESPAAPQEDDDMIPYEWSDGAIAYVDQAGNVYCPVVPGRTTAKHFKGIPSLREEFRRSFSGKTVALIGIDHNDSQAGYYIVDESWNATEFKFEPGVEKFF